MQFPQSDSCASSLPPFASQDIPAGSSSRQAQFTGNVQNDSRSANCISRGSPASELILPTEPLLRLEVGCPNSAWLNRLNTSQRNCRFALSRTGTSLSKAKSNTLVLGPRSVLRPKSP